MFDAKSLAFPVRTASTVSDLRVPAFALISRIQDEDPAVQIRALSLALAVVAEAIGTSAHDLIQASYRMMEQAEGPHTYHVQALREYAAKELCRRDD